MTVAIQVTGISERRVIPWEEDATTEDLSAEACRLALADAEMQPEEIDELEEAVGTRDAGRIEEEFGDLLFAVVNLARHLEVDPEKVLTCANFKFERRFRDMEAAIAAEGESIGKLSLETLDKHWREAKRRVG